ncbi:MAG: hypothetical protein FJ121_03785 [Deltaproteobacteria bacterium]|nr:hypothetical protein [Deltaproteobacteria bacterium]
MPILRDFKFFQVFLVILVSLVSLTTLTSMGYCEDDWVYVVENEDYIMYYKPSSVKIDKQKKIYEVLQKREFTEKGKVNFLNLYDILKKHKYNDINHTEMLYSVDYNKKKYNRTHITYYSKSGNVLFDGKPPIKWNDININTLGNEIFNKIMEDYNIQR